MSWRRATSSHLREGEREREARRRLWPMPPRKTPDTPRSHGMHMSLIRACVEGFCAGLAAATRTRWRVMYPTHVPKGRSVEKNNSSPMYKATIIEGSLYEFCNSLYSPTMLSGKLRRYFWIQPMKYFFFFEISWTIKLHAIGSSLSSLSLRFCSIESYSGK